MASEDIALGKNRGCWVGKETTRGTAATLTSAGFLQTVGEVKFSQKPQFEKNDEAALTFSQIGRDFVGYNGGEFSFDFKERPSGTLGVAPVGDCVLESWIGKKVVVTDTSVKYVPRTTTDPLVTFTMLVKKGNDTILMTGCAVKQGGKKYAIQPGADSIAKINISNGVFLRRYRAGTDALLSAIDGSVTPVTVIPLKTADAYKRYDPGARVTIGTDDASGVGHVIASVDATGNTITLSGTGVTTSQLINAVVKGWTPAAASAGYTMLNKFGITRMKKGSGSYANVYITEGEFNYDNGNHVLFEADGTAYPTDIAAGDRVLTASISRYVKQDCSDYAYDAENQVAIGIEFNSGNVAAKKSKVTLPKIEIDDPEESGDLERTIKISGDAFATASLDDEFELMYAA